MTTDVVETCAIAASLADNSHNGEPFAQNYRNIALAVIDALADGVSDEMADAAMRTYFVTGVYIDPNSAKARWFKRTIAAAIRAAKSREG